jgi:predicted metal-dependent hydrolase
MDKQTLICVSQNNNFMNLKSQLLDYQIITINEAGQYMNTLIEVRVAMILVDGTHPDWRRFTTSPKTSPATRRIPIIVASEDPQQLTDATMVGADLTLKLPDLKQRITKLVKDYGRIPDPVVMKQLECDCDEPLPRLALEGVKKFNAGEYYSQHDLFEEQWVKTESPVRDLYRAVLQVGVAYYQIERGNYRGALKMLQRSVQWLLILPDVCQGIDVAQLRQDSFNVRVELERLGENRLDEFDPSLLKPVKLVGKLE